MTRRSGWRVLVRTGTVHFFPVMYGYAFRARCGVVAFASALTMVRGRERICRTCVKRSTREEIERA